MKKVSIIKSNDNELPRLQLPISFNLQPSNEETEKNVITVKRRPNTTRTSVKNDQNIFNHYEPAIPKTERVRSKKKCLLINKHFQKMTEDYDLAIQNALSEYEQYEISKEAFANLVKEFPMHAESIEIVKRGYEEEIEKVEEEISQYMENQRAVYISERGFNSDICALQQKYDTKRKILTDRIKVAEEQIKLTREDIEGLRKEKIDKTERNKDLVYKTDDCVSYMSSLKREISVRNKQLEEMKTENEEIKKVLNSMKSKIEESRNDIDVTLGSSYNASNNIKKEKEELNKINSEIEKISNEIQKKQISINDLKKFEEEKNHEFQQIIHETEEFKNEINKMKGNLLFLNGGAGMKLPDDPIALLQFYLKYYRND